MVEPIKTTNQPLASYYASTDNPTPSVEEKIDEITQSNELLGHIYQKVRGGSNASPLQCLDTAERTLLATHIIEIER